MGSLTAAPPILVVALLLALSGLLVASGLAYWALSSGARLRLREGELAATQATLQAQSRELEQLKQEMGQLRQVPKTELLSMLQLAHELRSPLASIQSALDMLLQGYAKSDPELHDEMLGLARERAVSMLHQVNDFLRVGAVHHAEIQRRVGPVQLLDVLERLVPEKRVRARWRAVRFEVDVPDSLPTVYGTVEAMEHLLSNLINNAIKYTEPGGKVTVYLREEGQQVVGAVEDTGIGIAPEELPHIFDDFYRSEAAKQMDAHGTGLGLSIAKRVVDLYGGRLDVESQPGEGSTFSFRFPRAQGREEPIVVETRTFSPRTAQRASRRVSLMDGEEVKIFSDLYDSVIARGLCGKCGGCVSFCSAGQLNALEMGEDDLPRYADEEKCLKCGICYMICPVTSELDEELQRRFGWAAPIGVYERVRSARTTDDQVHEVATDGGVVTSLLLYMLDRHLIDGAIVSKKTAAFGRQPLIATTREELIAAAGSHFGGSAHLEELGERYTTYSPTISAVKGLQQQNLQRVAVVGTPCQIRSIKKMQALGILPAHLINYAIGLFCMENLVFDEAGRHRLERRLGIDLADVDKLNIKDDVIFTLQNGRTLHLPFEQVDDIARPACLACTDFANEFADLSVGGLGSPQGYTTVLIRSERGSQIYAEAVGRGYIEERSLGTWSEMRDREAGVLSQIVEFAQRKRTRGEERRKEAGIEGGFSGE